MFLAILAEGQVAFRDDQAMGLPDPIWDEQHKEFGLVAYSADKIKVSLDWMLRPLTGDIFGLRDAAGLKWEFAANKPTSGIEIINGKLAKALWAKSGLPYFRWSMKVEFSPVEFAAFEIEALHPGCFIKTTDDNYFMPLGLEGLEELPSSAVKFERSLHPLAALSASKPPSQQSLDGKPITPLEKPGKGAADIVTVTHTNGGSIPVDLSKLNGNGETAQILAALAALQGEVAQLRSQLANDPAAAPAAPAANSKTPITVPISRVQTAGRAVHSV